MGTQIDLDRTMDHRVTFNNDPSGDKKSPSPVASGSSSNRIKVVYVDVTDYDQATQFFICCVAVFVLFVIYGYLQELIFTLEGFKPFGWYLTLVQFGFYSIFGYLENLVTVATSRKIPIQVYLLLAFLTLGTIGFSNYSLSYLNYPTQVIFKCCKLIPVMIGSIIIQKKKYKLIDFLAVMCMSVGLSYFTLADSQISPTFSLFGVGMISCALLCDAVIGNVQEKWMKSTGAENAEIVLYSYSMGFAFLFVIMTLSGDLFQGFYFCQDKPSIYGYAMLFSLSGYLGVQVVLSLVKMTGALVAVTVTTCRKAVSIILSFVLFSKPFTIHYLWAGSLVVLGIYLNLAAKNNHLLGMLLRPWRRLTGRRPNKSHEMNV